ncbi:MAG: methionine--tRNA ligase [Candidatus Gracilibacteria bacterium]
MTKHLITTAIPYMNGAPHVGHAFEMVLTDVIVRGRRLIGDDIFFLTGADEHGSKIAKTAEGLGVPVVQMLDENVARFQEMNTYLNVVADDYLRTTDKEKHWPVVQALWMKMVENINPETGESDIYKKQYAGYYCDREERFVTEAELDADKNVIESGAPTRWAEDENYFFRLSRYSNDIKKKIENDDVKIIPEFRKNEMLAMIGDGLEDVSFSRTKKQLSWGIPVPNDDNHVMYVWCDALTNYISGSPENHGNIDELFKNWSCDLHVIGKDIARFHCLTWIGMLLSAEIKLPTEILVHGFVNDKDGAKMSKSVGNVIDPHEMVNSYCSDTFRLYITGEVGVGQDLNFSDDRIKAIHNDMLANNYGNLVNRILSLWTNFRDNEIPTLTELEGKGWDILENQPSFEETYKGGIEYKNAIAEYDTRKAFMCIEGILNEANARINRLEPWKKSGEEKGKILVTGLVYVYYTTLLLSPFIPEATGKVMKAMGINPNTTLDTPMNIDLNTITKPEILFEKK